MPTRVHINAPTHPRTHTFDSLVDTQLTIKAKGCGHQRRLARPLVQSRHGRGKGAEFILVAQQEPEPRNGARTRPGRRHQHLVRVAQAIAPRQRLHAAAHLLHVCPVGRHPGAAAPSGLAAL